MTKIINYKSWKSVIDKTSRSFRGSDYYPSDKKIKKIVFKGLFVILIIYLFYLLFFSHYLAINNIKITVKDPDFNTEELNNYLKEILNKKILLILPHDNYLFLTRNYLENELKNKYVIEELLIEKKFPNTLNINLKEKITNLLYQTNESIYLIDNQGKILSIVGERIIINEKQLIKIIDESNTQININQNILTPSLINLIINLKEKFNDYLKNLSILEFRIISPDARFVKIITSSDIEIHLNDRLSVEEQLEKLKKSLESEMIDLSKIQYINLRVKGQVIYK